MSLDRGTKLGPHEILEPIGAGGMGEVYKARDTRLNRFVAVKISAAQFSERFEREARAVAALNHPHICTLYDVGPNYLVMEYIEGQPLLGPLPLHQVLQYAVQICDALDAAHRKGITHRDLKPANILVTRTGIKLLDFGLAKLSPDGAPSGPRAVNVATETIALTQANTILGTLQYIAPEQLEGKDADARSDIFAFGAVLYEMLTGKRAFTGQSRASVIAAILERDPPSLAGAAPARLDRLLRRCLAKNPEDRWQSARDLKFELEGIAEPELAPATAKPGRLLPWIAACVLLALAAAYAWLRAPASRHGPLQLALTTPSGVEFAEYGGAISPDGHLFAFTAIKEGKRQLWLRSLDSSFVRPLQGTEDAAYPFWSPDSRSLGFFTNGKLKRVDLGGPVQDLCDSILGRGGSWSPRGVIVFSRAPVSPLFQVPASGGQRVQLTNLDSSRQEISHAWPQFLPDGRHFLYMAASASPQSSAIFLGDLDAASPKPVRVVTSDAPAIYASGAGARRGWLLFSRDRILTYQPMDPATAHLDGEPLPIPGVEPIPGAPAPVFLDLSASVTGLLAYRSGPRSASQIVRRQRSGGAIESLAPLDDYSTLAVSPDSRTLAVGRAPASGNHDIWLLDLSRRVFSRFTFGPYLNFYPVWSPDGHSIFFTSSEESGAGNLYLRAADGAGEKQILTPVGSIQNSLSWSSDGRFRLYGQMSANKSWDLWIQPTATGDKPFPFLQSPAMEMHGQFSPDGKWIAYTSDESGADQVYVQAFAGGPASGAKLQVSTTIGRQPRWRGDGREMFYVAGDGKMMAVAVKPSATGLQMGAPVALFDAHLLIALSSARFNYDVTRDGQQFYLLARDETVRANPVTILVDWQSGLKK
jgi:Tol biopolymer transport system component/tRNA A-37 threonylcarbamoyl transferase component Bud32